MADDWATLSSGISGATIPTSDNLAADRDATRALIALASSGQPLDGAFLEKLEIRVTPWVAWQIGIYTEHVAVDTPHALAAVMLALWTAARSRDPARILANRLTAANTAMRLGARDLAETLYESILESPLSLHTPERAGAYGGMANLKLLQGDHRDAAYYFGKCLTSPHQLLDETARRQTFVNAAICCLQCRDLGGALVFMTAVDKTTAGRLEKDLRTQPLSLEERLLITARLHVLGAGATAEALQAVWNKATGNQALKNKERKRP